MNYVRDQLIFLENGLGGILMMFAVFGVIFAIGQVIDYFNGEDDAEY